MLHPMQVFILQESGRVTVKKSRSIVFDSFNMTSMCCIPSIFKFCYNSNIFVIFAIDFLNINSYKCEK